MSSHKSSFNDADVKIEEITPEYQGFFKINRYQLKHKLFEGGWSKTVTRELFERGHAVAVLPYDPLREEFVLIEQFRVGAMATSESPWLIEVIAGMIDHGETEADVCVREAKEEADIELTGLYKACSYLSSPGGTSERLGIFMARVDASKAQGIHGLDTETEDIKVHCIAEQTAKEWLDNGTIDNAAAIIALQWFFLNKDSLLTFWNNKSG